MIHKPFKKKLVYEVWLKKDGLRKYHGAKETLAEAVDLVIKMRKRHGYAS